MNARRLVCVWAVFLLWAAGDWAVAAVNAGSPYGAVEHRLYDDPRLVGWSRDFLAGRRGAVLRSAAQDLKASAPHPYAAYVWTVTQYRLGRLEQALDDLRDDRLRAALGPLPRIYLLDMENAYEMLLAEFPPARAAEISDVWALFHLSAVAYDERRWQDALAYLKAAIRLQPDNFLITWAFYELAQKEITRPTIEAMFTGGGRFAETMTGRFLAAALRYRLTDKHEELQGIEIWLKQRPHDARALRFQGLRLSGLERYAQAAAVLARATERFPFTSYWSEQAEALIKLDRIEEARRVVVRAAALRSSNKIDAQPLAEQYLAEALADAGEKGEARKVLDAALKLWPDHAGLLNRYTGLELDSGRPAYAVAYARQAARLKPDSLYYQVQLIKTHRRRGLLQQAFDVFTAVGRRLNRRSEGFFALGSELLGALGRSKDRVRLCRRAVGRFPGSAWMHRQLAVALGQAGRPGEALQQLEASFKIEAPNQWSVQKYRDLATAWHGRRKADGEMANLRRRFFWVQALWDDAAAQIKGADAADRKIALWKKAIAANSKRRWPWRACINVLTENERWEAAHRIAEEEYTALKGAPAGDRVEARFDRAVVHILRLRKQQLDHDTLERALGRLADYRAAGGYSAAYHQFRAEVLQALGRDHEAARELLAALKRRPDQDDLVWDLVTRYAGELGEGTVLAQAHRYVDRDPFDGKRLARLVHLNVMWHGSPIIALQVIDRIRQVAPDHLNASHESLAWGKLGDHAKRFEVWYGRAQSIENSDRYIRFYENARRKAYVKSAKIEIDYETGLCRILQPDGRILLRQDHPVSGKPLLVQIGRARMEFQYDRNGDNLREIRSSSGATLEIDYDERRMIPKVVLTRRGTAPWEIRFTYNAAQKPTLIAVYDQAGGSELGGLKVDYDQRNVVSKAQYYGSSGVRTVIQTLVSLLKAYAAGEAAEIPELPYTDEKLDELRSSYNAMRIDYRKAPGVETLRSLGVAAIALINYLMNHLADHRSHADEARLVANKLIRMAMASPFLRVGSDVGVQAVGRWYELMKTIRPEGLTAADWNRWRRMQAWLEERAGRLEADNRAKELLDRIERQDALRLLENARWLPRSVISNPAYYRRYRRGELIPESVVGAAAINTLLIRQNQDVILGTSVGVSVLRKGYWEWFGFDQSVSRFSSAIAPDDVKASSDVLSLAEDGEGKLWIGTANGLIRLPEDYDGPLQRWTTPGEGLPSPRVEHLAWSGDEMFVATAGGLRIHASGGFKPVAGLENENLRFLRAAPPPITGDSAPEPAAPAPLPALAGAGDGLYALASGRAIKLYDGRVEDAIWSPLLDKVFMLQNDRLFAFQWDGADPRVKPKYVHGQQDVVYARKIHGLAVLPLDRRNRAVAVLTDLGMSVYHDSHFEHLDLPRLLADRRAGVTALASRALRTFMISSEGLYALEQGQMTIDTAKRVYDLLTIDAWQATFVARGDRLQQVLHDKPAAGVHTVDWIAATHLAQDPAGALIVNDGLTILRYAVNARSPATLFTAQQTVVEPWKPGAVTSLLAASDGTIWVTAGASLFRHRDGKTEEFSIFVDQERFPARSEMISRVIETIEGNIWVVASDESHLNFHGMILEGGVLQWTGDRFRRLDLSGHTDAWFITGYTPIGGGAAIVGTTQGFARHRGGRFATLEQLKDASYAALVERTPLLWLGRRGAKLGKDIVLFGCAGGVVAYREGIWFYPDRLNRMLPDQHLSQYGGRTTHAVATDELGRVYVGTDRGLLIYDSGGGEAAGFLVSNQFEQLAFSAAEQAKLGRQAEIFKKRLRPDSEVGRRFAKIRQTRHEIDALKAALAPGFKIGAAAIEGRNRLPDPAAKETEATPVKLRKRLADKEREHRALLARLERENPGLFQLLELKPLDLIALRKELSPKQAIVQYLPTDKKLYIQLIAREGSQIREVQVTRDELYRRALAAARLLATGRPPAGPEHGGGDISAREPDPNDFSDRSAARGAMPRPGGAFDPGLLDAHLAWLYERLLRPFEHTMSVYRHVFIVPVGPLTYLPFAALIRSGSATVEYAVERFTFGYLPSMYLFDLVLRDEPSVASDALVMGDPDGSLNGARAEAIIVKQILGGRFEPHIGPQASYANLLKLAPQARVLHLATHGRLNWEKPEESYLLLADGYRLNVIDAQGLPLGETDLVVLSACETGIGRDGMEYATLARAFAHAGVPTIVATLWPIEDQAGRRLTEFFYKRLVAGDDVFTALASAQRLLMSEAGYRRPGAWAGYIPFGRQ